MERPDERGLKRTLPWRVAPRGRVDELLVHRIDLLAQPIRPFIEMTWSRATSAWRDATRSRSRVGPPEAGWTFTVGNLRDSPKESPQAVIHGTS
jgi:hypothetical protein